MLTAGDVYEVVTTQSYGGSTLLNVIHVDLLINLTGAQAKFQTLADNLKEAMRPSQTTTLTYQTWKATQVAGAGITYSTTTCRRTGGDVYEGNHTGTLTGSFAGAAAGPSFQACVVALKTGFAGRSYRGAVYVGGVDANALDSTDRDHFTSAYLTAQSTGWGTFFTKYSVPGGTDPNFGWVVWSKVIASGCKYVPASPKWIYTHVVAGDQVNSFKPVTSYTPRQLVVPMRRRKEGRGS